MALYESAENEVYLTREKAIFEKSSQSHIASIQNATRDEKDIYKTHSGKSRHQPSQ